MVGVIITKSRRHCVFLKWSEEKWREWEETKNRGSGYVKWSDDWLIAPLEEIQWME